MDCLHTPTGTHELRSQEVEKFGVDAAPDTPRLSTVATSPVPKWCCQMRLTMTRAKSGFSGDVTQFANAVRRPEETRPGGCGSIRKVLTGEQNADGTPGCTLPGRLCCPRAQKVMRRRFWVGFHKRRDLFERTRRSLPLRNRLGDAVEALRTPGTACQLVVADLDRLCVSLQNRLLLRGTLVLRCPKRIDHRVALRRRQILESLAEELLAERLRERGQSAARQPSLRRSIRSLRRVHAATSAAVPTESRGHSAWSSARAVDREQDRLKAVILLLHQRFEFVVVTRSALHRQPQQAVHDVLQVSPRTVWN